MKESKESIAQALRVIIDRLRRNDIIEAYKECGIRLLDDNGEFIEPLDLLNAVEETLSKFKTSDPRITRTIELMGGVRQMSKVVPLFKDPDVRKQFVEIYNQYDKEQS